MHKGCITQTCTCVCTNIASFRPAAIQHVSLDSSSSDLLLQHHFRYQFPRVGQSSRCINQHKCTWCIFEVSAKKADTTGYRSCSYGHGAVVTDVQACAHAPGMPICIDMHCCMSRRPQHSGQLRPNDGTVTRLLRIHGVKIGIRYIHHLLVLPTVHMRVAEAPIRPTS